MAVKYFIMLYFLTDIMLFHFSPLISYIHPSLGYIGIINNMKKKNKIESKVR